MRTRRAVFLDRDGVVVRERGEHTWRVDDLEMLPTVAEAVKAVRAQGNLAVIITNQSGIALGLYTHADVERAHAWIGACLSEEGTQLDAVYYCPHHPSQGRCLCRKPGSLMLERAMARYGIDPGASVMIGDRDRDVEAATAVGVRGVLVEANSPLLDVLRTRTSLI
ncbi:MAG TPA: HAD family hydrolase [Flavobacteriales bacterium]|nr:HAD family hydrolase [Flavobacteriales bacterium]